ncbi:hypothetical protein DCAR_0310749 [Daucus carota subsp. sativus]|uniref:Helicase ATP-binding domain-containing protein n=1 Tax=Daucus carota subsp. sativus TaxID=79200 RepID=A0AAF1AT80_DAUCS|nr:hypothetical protein DCAR_0310749 [Daucus carota subsp. sativus]
MPPNGVRLFVQGIHVLILHCLIIFFCMTEQDVSEYRKSLAIRVSGFDVPRHVKTFEDCGFSVEIMKAISGQAYEKTASIQCQDFPVVLSERDIIGIAKTGSGKTAAFVLPMIVHIMDQPELEKEEGPIGVILYGGMSKLEQFKELKAGGEIVVATPGRLIDLLKMKALTMSRATYLVLDEADRMFDLGFEPQIRSIVGLIMPDRGKRAKGRGGGDNRGVRGVDFGLGIGYNAESKRSPSHVVPGRSAAVNSLKTGMTTQFKSSFVAALSGTLNARLSNSSGMQAGNRVLRGFVSGGSGSSKERARERRRPSGWDRQILQWEDVYKLSLMRCLSSLLFNLPNVLCCFKKKDTPLYGHSCAVG